MVEIIRQFFGNSVSAVEAFVGIVGIGEILTLFLTIFVIVYKGKKFDKATEQIQKEANEERKKFEEKHNKEMEALKEGLTKDLDNISNMVMLEAMKNGVNIDQFNQIVELYKKVIKDELLDTDKLEAEKQEQVEQEQTQQDSVNENLKNIDALNDLV